MPDTTGIFLGWSANLNNFLGLGVEAGASPMYPQKMRVPPLGALTRDANSDTQSSDISAEEIRESVRSFQPLIVGGKKLFLYASFPAEGI